MPGIWLASVCPLLSYLHPVHAFGSDEQLSFSDVGNRDLPFCTELCTGSANNMHKYSLDLSLEVESRHSNPSRVKESFQGREPSL